MANAEQRELWDGPSGSFWSAWADRFDAAVGDFQPRLLAAVRAALPPGGTVLDVGCGAGRTTLDVAAFAGEVHGVDLSAELLAIARARAAREGAAVRFDRADAQTADLGGPYDLVVSRNGTMFFDDTVAAFGNIAAALRPGGALVLQTWQAFARNEWFRTFLTIAGGGTAEPPPVEPPSPCGLSEPDRIRTVLGAAGFTGVRLTPMDGTMYAGADVADAFRYITAQQAARLDELGPAGRARAEEELRADLAAHLGPGGVRYGAAAWLVEARAAGS